MRTIKETIKPHEDIELGWPRREIEYYLTFPDHDISEDTGVILSICGFNEQADSEYQTKKLRPYLANKYNCIVIGVNYFGIHRNTYIESVYFEENFVKLLEEYYGVPEYLFKDRVFNSVQEIFNFLDELLKDKVKLFGTNLCRPIFKMENEEYQSFGLIPAIDHLQVLGQVLKKYPVDPRRIISFGSSYGGYIGLLLGKLAPHTFSVIIDNSGFSRTPLVEVVSKELVYPSWKLVQGNHTTFYGVRNDPWTLIDEQSPSYFSDSCRKIRSLLYEPHRIASETRYYIFHAECDDVASIIDKDEAVNILKHYNEVYYKRMNSDDIDGVIFKAYRHAMDVSLRKLFDHVHQFDNKKMLKNHETTDFHLNSMHRFVSGDRIYIFQYTEKYDIKVTLEGR